MITIFGASGDLTARKLVPALYTLWADGYLGDHCPVVGVARREITDESFRTRMRDAVGRHARAGAPTDQQWAEFSRRLFYRRLDMMDAGAYSGLQSELDGIASSFGGAPSRVAYLATAPSLFIPAAQAMSVAGMIPGPDDDSTLRVVFEKPFGRDLESSQELSKELGRLLREDQMYRIDHYLGKETVQNILLFRFGNAIFEPLLSRNHVDHVQITVAESQGMEGGRAGYYDRSGALRDVLQNHVLQLLCLVAMEPPAQFTADRIRDEKLKVLQAMRPGSHHSIADWAVAGQYLAGSINGESVTGYRDEDRVNPESRRETYVAMKVFIDNWRWAGVPFYLRTGKRMPKRVTEIGIQFKHAPLNLFSTVECEGDLCERVEQRPNSLIFRIQPQEAIDLSFSTKRPGMQYQVEPVTMDFEYGEKFGDRLPEAYERLLLDVLRGDSTLFTRSDELESAWRFVTPVLDDWESGGREPEFYPAGTWGPEAANRLITSSGHHWRSPDPGE